MLVHFEHTRCADGHSVITTGDFSNASVYTMKLKNPNGEVISQTIFNNSYDAFEVHYKTVDQHGGERITMPQFVSNVN